MVKTRNQAAETSQPPTPILPFPRPRMGKARGGKRKGRTTQLMTGDDDSPETPSNPQQDTGDDSPENIQQQPHQDGTGLIIQQQVAQHLATLVQALTLQPLSMSGTTTNAAAPTASIPPSKHVPAPRLSAPNGMSIIQFRDWKQRWIDFSTTQQIGKYPLDAQHGILRSAIDSEWTILWNSSRINVKHDTPISEILTLMESYLRRKRNPLLDRQEFHRRDQMSGECVDRYYAALKTLDEACGHEDEIRCPNCLFGPCTCGAQTILDKQMQDIRIRDRFIVGLRDKEMQRRILSEQYNSVLTIEKVLSICTAIENSNATGTSLGQPYGAEQDVYATSSYKKQTNPYSISGSRNNNQNRQCIWCGGQRHGRERCPAKTKKCKYCGKIGHYEFVCLQKRREVNFLDQNSATHWEKQEEMAENKSAKNVSIFKAGKIENSLQIPTEFSNTTHLISWLPDTGADVDAISFDSIKALGGNVAASMTSEKQEVYAANGSSLGPLGSISATLKFNNRSYSTLIRVFKHLTTPLLSKAGCVSLGLLDSNWPHNTIEVPESTQEIQNISTGMKHVVEVNITPENTDNIKQTLLQDLAPAFDDTVLRPMNGPPMKITLVPDAKPCKRYKAYNVPFHWQEKVKSQLEEMKTKGIIEAVPVGEPVDWCHPMVVVPKKGTAEPRITVDLTGLNPYVRRPVYPVKVPREAVAKIPPGMKYFSTLDARHGYWQVPLDEDSKKLTTFITPWGCFRYCRNVMGLISAGDEHNRRGDEAIKGISNVDKVVEDIIIYDNNLEEHTKRVREVIEKCVKHGITLNKKKFIFAQPEVDWCGFSVSQSGYTPALHLVQALKQFPVPTSKTDVRSFCGLVQQFESFSSKISSLALPLRALLQKNAAFLWESVHQQAFDAIILELASPRVLTQFHPSRPVRLETDGAQSKGLGFALWQQQPDTSWKLLQAGSRFVTPIEARYSATEIELLAVVWAVKKCRLFLLGNPFELVVDHRPLTAIINSKTLDEIENPRLQRLKEKLACFRPHAVWRAGKQHIVVDVFSRYPSSAPTPEDQMDVDHPRNLAITLKDSEDGSSILQDPILHSIHEAGSVCGEYRRLIQLITNGFPCHKENLDEDLRPYWKIKDGLNEENGIILWGNRILIPINVRRRILDVLHSSHQGQERTLRRARQAVFWPNITNDIKNVIRGCNECAIRLPSQQKEPMVRDAPSQYPFQCVGVDLFKHAGYEYLVMVDKFSGWISVEKCGRSANAGIVIHHLKRWIMDLGIPERLISDNGPQFASIEFKNWAKKWGIRHDPSSPHYPQANGLAESGVKAASYLLAKTSPHGDLSCEAFQLGLLELRNTPRADGRSPAQLVFGHPIRTQLPLHRSRFANIWKKRSDDADERAVRLREKAEKYYNTTAKPMPRLKRGDVVRLQDPRTKEWNKVGEIIEINARGRSYIIRTESGRTYWRNRRFIRRFYPSQGTNTTSSPVEITETLPRRSARRRNAPQRFGFALQRDPRSHSKGGHEVFPFVLPHPEEPRHRYGLNDTLAEAAVEVAAGSST